MDNREPLLRVENLCQYFGPVKAVENVSFTVEEGEVFGLVGESGCGKTTTGRSIIKIYDITSGSIWFQGHRISAGTQSYREALKEKGLSRQEIARLRQEIRRAEHDRRNCDREYAKARMEAVRQRYAPLLKSGDKSLRQQYRRELRAAAKSRLVTRIQMIFQDPMASLNPRMTVREIIAEGLVIGGIRDKAYIDEKVYEMLELVGLRREHAGRYPHEFSGGQRQRIGIARAVIMEPRLLIADEPISALDVSIQAQVINLLNDLRQKLGLTILFIAHDLSVVKYFCDRIGVMYRGRLVELATSEELFAHPLHPYTQSLLSAIPLPDPRAEKRRQRVAYTPPEGAQKLAMEEINPGHFVLCAPEEAARLRKERGA